MRRAFLGLIMLPVLPPAVLAQGPPGTNLAVEVGFRRIVMRADTVRIEYLVRNGQDSKEKLFDFTVEAPSNVIRIELPHPEENWDTGTVSKTLSVASWALLDKQLPAGATTPPLAFEALGLPGIVTYWALGWFPVDRLEDDVQEEPPPPMSPREALASGTVEGRTVGVDPLPAERSPEALLHRLTGLLDESCGALSWITSASVCGGLKSKLQQTGRAITQRDYRSARDRLAGFLAELTARHNAAGTLPVTHAAFWLLRVNAEYLRRQLTS